MPVPRAGRGEGPGAGDVSGITPWVRGRLGRVHPLVMSGGDARDAVG
jgi:hypothetical protein